MGKAARFNARCVLKRSSYLQKFRRSADIHTGCSTSTLTWSVKVCIILDVATPDQIPELMSHFTESPFYRQFRSKDEKDAEQYCVSAVFHLCGDEVLEDPMYKEFMSGFPETTNVSVRFGKTSHLLMRSHCTQHVVSSRKHLSDPVSFGNAALNQCKLNQLDAQMFPTQHFRSEPVKQLSGMCTRGCSPYQLH